MSDCVSKVEKGNSRCQASTVKRYQEAYKCNNTLLSVCVASIAALCPLHLLALATPRLAQQQPSQLALFPHIQPQIAFMSSFQHEVKCTTSDDGAVWMHLDVRVPPHVLNQSQVFMDAMPSDDDHSIARDFTLAAPNEWLQVWSLCCCSDEQRLNCASTRDLVTCLLARSCFFLASFTALYAQALTCAANVFTATRELHSTLLYNSMKS
jgi:hypothetical protein